MALRDRHSPNSLTEWLSSAVLCQMFAFAWLWQIWLSQEQSFLNNGWDTTYQTYAWLSYNFEALRAGVLPLWDFRSSSGLSHVGEMQPGALYPLVWLFAMFATPGDPLFVNIFIVMHFGIAMHCMRTLLRAQGFGFWASLIGAVLYAFCGSVAMRANAQANLFFGLAWMPLFFQGYLRAQQSENRLRDWSALRLMAVALSLMVLAGHVHAVIVIVLAVITMECANHWSVIKSRRLLAEELMTLRLILAAGIVACVLAAPQLFASAEYLRHAMKWYGEGATKFPHHVPLAAKAEFSLALSDLLTFLSPNFKAASAELLSLFVTCTGLLFALIGAIWPRPEHQFLRRNLLLGSLFCLLLAYVGRTPLGFLLQLPVVNLLRSPVRAVHGLHLFVCVLAAIGIAQSVAIAKQFLHAKGPSTNWFRFSIVISLAISALAALSVELWRFQPFLSAPMSAAITPQTSTLGAKLLLKIKSLEAQDRAMYRYTISPNDLYSPNASMVLGIRHTRGYRSSMPKDYFEFLGRNWSPDSFVYDTLASRYLISIESFPALKVLAQDGDRILYLRESAKPVLTRLGGEAIVGAMADWGINSVRFNFPDNISGTLVFAQMSFPGWWYRTSPSGAWIAADRSKDLFLMAEVSNARSLEFAYRPTKLFIVMAFAVCAWLLILVSCFTPVIGAFLITQVRRRLR